MSIGKFTKDLSGLKIGKLTVIGRGPNRTEGSEGKKKSIRATWHCECECGNFVTVNAHSLKKAMDHPEGRAGTKSCGCLYGKHAVKHGKATDPVYRVWNSMVQRCTNPNNTGYASYGGRGVNVCDKWLKFEGFIEDMGDRPESLTIDRIDPNGDYCKENCRWVTMKVQGNNRRTNRVIEYNGVSKTMQEWAEHLCINKGTLRNRLDRGWPLDKALSI